MIVKLIFMDDLTQSYAHLDYSSKLSSAEALVSGLNLGLGENDDDDTSDSDSATGEKTEEK